MIMIIWLLPLLGIPFSLLASRRKKGIVASIFSLLSFFSLLLFVEIPAKASIFGLNLLIDNLSLVFSLVVSFIGAVILFYSSAYMKEKEGLNRYYTTMLLFLSSMLILVQSTNFLSFYAGWELVGFCSYFLISFYYKRKAAQRAGIKAFVVTRIGDIALLLAILLIFTETGSLRFSAISKANSLSISILFLIGAIAKSAQLPLHVWLPDAMEGPTPVSALLHSATMVKAGVYLLARFYPFFSHFPAWKYSILIVGGLSAFMASIMAIFSFDIKEILAYSTISQLGYLFLGVGAGSFLATSFHLVNHALFKSLLFLGSGCIIHLAGTRNIKEMGKIKSKFVVLPFLIGSLSLAGIPPLGGYFSKEAIISSIFPYKLPYFLALVTIPFTFFYALRVPFRAFFQGEENKEEPQRYLVYPLILLAVLVTLGLTFKPFLETCFQVHEALIPLHPANTFYSAAALAFGALFFYLFCYKIELKLSKKLRGNPFFHILSKLGEEKFYLNKAFVSLSGLYLKLSKIVSKLEKVIEKANLMIPEVYLKLTWTLSFIEDLYRKLSHSLKEGVLELSKGVKAVEIGGYQGLNFILVFETKEISRGFRELEIEEIDVGVFSLILGIIFILSFQLILIWF